MARPTKQGIDYFPLDVKFDNDTEMYLIENEAVGLAVLVTLWQIIYSDNGYYTSYGNDLFLLIKKRINVSVEDIKKCINSAIERGILNKHLYKKYKILTSKGLQERFFEAAKRKKAVYYDSRFFLCKSVNAYDNLINVNKNRVNVLHQSPKEEVDREVNVKEEVDSKNNKCKHLSVTNKVTVIDENSEKEFSEIRNKWNRFSVENNLPACLKITQDRKIILNERLKENEFDFTQILENIKNSDYLLGKVNGFKVSFDWIIRQENYTKILEGKYQNGNTERNGRKDNSRTKSERKSFEGGNRI